MKTNSHAEETSSVVLQGEVLVCEGFGAVDGGAAGAVAIEEVAALDHEVTNLEECQYQITVVDRWIKKCNQGLVQ